MILSAPQLAAVSGMGAMVLYLVLDVLRSTRVPWVEDAGTGRCVGILPS
jgi:hypothetical protein